MSTRNDDQKKQPAPNAAASAIDGIRFSYIVNEFIPNASTTTSTPLHELTTAEVCEQIIKPMTKTTKMTMSETTTKSIDKAGSSGHDHQQEKSGQSFCEMLREQNHWAVINNKNSKGGAAKRPSLRSCSQDSSFSS